MLIPSHHFFQLKSPFPLKIKTKTAGTAPVLAVPSSARSGSHKRESGAVQKGTGKGRRGKWRWPPDWAVKREPFGRVKGIGGRVAGCTRWEREGKTDSRSKTWVAPESARIEGEGVIEQNKAGEGGSSPSESYGDSRATKGLGEAKREWV
jgi:hypothetical protein